MRLWPRIDYYAELRPRADEEHPVDALLAESPIVRQAYRRVLDLEPTLSRSGGAAFREYADARLHLQSLREDLAFNVGVEVGAAAARVETLNRSTGRRGPPISAIACRLLGDGELRADERLLAFIEAAWALARGPVATEAVSAVAGARRARRRGSPPR